MAAPSNPGNPPQPAPSALVKVFASVPFTDQQGILTPPALQFLTRLVGTVSGGGGIIDIIINNITANTTNVSISDVQAASDDLRAALSFPGSVAAVVARLAALEKAVAPLFAESAPLGPLLQRLGWAEQLAVLAFNRALSGGGGAGLALQVGGSPQSAGTLNFASGFTGSVSGGVLTVTAAGGAGHDNFIAHGLSAPMASSFAWINQGSATATNLTNGPLQFVYPAAASLSLAFFGEAVPVSAPWTTTGELAITQANSNAHVAGIAVSDGTKFLVLYLGPNGVTVQGWTSTTSGGSDNYSTAWTIPGPVIFMRIYDDGTDYNFQISGDGTSGSYSTLFSIGNTSFLTGTKVGLAATNNTSGDGQQTINCWGWEAVTGTGTALGF